jgi:hypothetical protein
MGALALPRIEAAQPSIAITLDADCQPELAARLNPVALQAAAPPRAPIQPLHYAQSASASAPVRSAKAPASSGSKSSLWIGLLALCMFGLCLGVYVASREPEKPIGIGSSGPSIASNTGAPPSLLTSAPSASEAALPLSPVPSLGGKASGPVLPKVPGPRIVPAPTSTSGRPSGLEFPPQRPPQPTSAKTATSGSVPAPPASSGVQWM